MVWSEKMYIISDQIFFENINNVFGCFLSDLNNDIVPIWITINIRFEIE